MLWPRRTHPTADLGGRNPDHAHPTSDRPITPARREAPGCGDGDDARLFPYAGDADSGWPRHRVVGRRARRSS